MVAYRSTRAVLDGEVEAACRALEDSIHGAASKASASSSLARARTCVTVLREQAARAQTATDLRRAIDEATEGVSSALAVAEWRSAVRWPLRTKVLGAIGLAAFVALASGAFGALVERRAGLSTVCHDLCAYDGRCALRWSAVLRTDFPARPWDCTAIDEEDCDTPCSEHGKCELIAGQCNPPNGEACRQSRGCRERGECAATRNGYCSIDRAGCSASLGCKVAGRCAVGTYECIVLSDADCLVSEECTRWGRCHAHDGVCVARVGKPAASVGPE
jgi:hypothetical protein